MDGNTKVVELNDTTDPIDNQQRAVWLDEQASIASQVVVLPEKPMNAIAITMDERFSLVPCRSLLPFASKATLFGGVDVSFPADPSQHSVAVYVILDSSGQLVYQDYELFLLSVPYIPTFLAFRELDPLQRLVEKQLQLHPDLTPTCLLVDGNGVLHPRGAGIASCLGVRTGVPTIGVGKTLLAEGGLRKVIVQRGLDGALQRAATAAHAFAQSDLTEANREICVLFDSQPITGDPNALAHIGDEHSRHNSGGIDRTDLLCALAPICQGFAVPLGCYRGTLGCDSLHPEVKRRQEVLACALVGHGGRLGSSRRKIGSKNPVYVSVGHRMSLQAAIAICTFLSLARIPEPIRQADLIGRALLRKVQYSRS